MRTFRQFLGAASLLGAAIFAAGCAKVEGAVEPPPPPPPAQPYLAITPRTATIPLNQPLVGGLVFRDAEVTTELVGSMFYDPWNAKPLPRETVLADTQSGKYVYSPSATFPRQGPERKIAFRGHNPRLSASVDAVDTATVVLTMPVPTTFSVVSSRICAHGSSRMHFHVPDSVLFADNGMNVYGSQVQLLFPGQDYRPGKGAGLYWLSRNDAYQYLSGPVTGPGLPVGWEIRYYLENGVVKPDQHQGPPILELQGGGVATNVVTMIVQDCIGDATNLVASGAVVPTMVVTVVDDAASAAESSASGASAGAITARSASPAANPVIQETGSAVKTNDGHLFIQRRARITVPKK